MTKRPNSTRDRRASQFLRYHLAAVALGSSSAAGQEYLRKAWRVMRPLLRQNEKTALAVVRHAAHAEKLIARHAA